MSLVCSSITLFLYGYVLSEAIGPLCQQCVPTKECPICETGIDYPICIWNSDKQRATLLQGILLFQEKQAAKKLSKDCKNAYLAYLCAAAYPSCDESLI